MKAPELPTSWKLMIFLAAVLLPVSAFSLALVQRQVESTVVSARAHNLDRALAGAERVDGLFVNTETMLRTIASLPEVVTLDGERAGESLKAILASDSDLISISIAYHDGSALTVDQEGSRTPGRTELRRLSQIVEGYAPQPAQRGISHDPAEHSVEVWSTVRGNDGREIGVVAAKLFSASLERRLAPQTNGATLLLVDENGVSVAQAGPTAPASVPGLLFQVLASRANGPQPGILEFSVPLDRAPRLAAYAPSAQTGWTVIAIYPSNPVQARAQEELTRGILALSLALISACLAGVFLGRWIVRPLQYLSAKAQHTMVQAFRQEVQSKIGDDLQPLASAFDLLSENLKETNRQLMVLEEESMEYALELQQALARSAGVREEERRRIALDMHDGVAQSVARALYEVRGFTRQVSRDPERAKERLQATQEILQSTVGEIRRACFALYPPKLEEMGLIPAIEDCVKDFQQGSTVSCRLIVEGIPVKLAKSAEMAFYRIVQEALHNVEKHARANRADVRIEFTPTQARVTIHDDGEGFDSRDIGRIRTKHLGLLSMEERAQSIGGKMAIESSPHSGTTIVVQLNLSEVAKQDDTRESLRTGGKEALEKPL